MAYCNYTQIIETGIATTRGGLSSRILPEEASTKGVSHIVQGTGSDILHRILLTINEPLSKVGAYLQLPIHDGLLIASPIGREDEVIAIVKGVMNNAVSAILPGYSIGITCEKGWKMKNENWEHCNLDPRNK